jgi:hypothetical protein
MTIERLAAEQASLGKCEACRKYQLSVGHPPLWSNREGLFL